MGFTLALAGDTMLGRGVARRLLDDPRHALVAGEVADAAAGTDLFVVNLECCVSDRGTRWPDPRKPFFFRAPPVAAGRLRELGVRLVNLANNHALDYGAAALVDTFAHLDRAGIRWVGAGEHERAARAVRTVDVAGARVAFVGVADHPRDYAAGPDRSGIAYADLAAGVPEWALRTVAGAGTGADAVVVMPHWGPNMVAAPVPHVRAAAGRLLDAGATLVAGHSAHVFHGVERSGDRLVLYDLGDFLDDYAVDPDLRNDLGLLWLVEVPDRGEPRVAAVPLALEVAFTRLAAGAEREWIARRLAAACAPFGLEVTDRGDRLAIGRAAPPAPHPR